MNLIFFGSFQHYSTLILESLHKHTDINVVGVITTPPMPAGRKQTLQKTHTHSWAETNNVPVLTPDKLDSSTIDELDRLLKSSSSSRSSQVSSQKPDSRGISRNNLPTFFVVAGYGKILPKSWLNFPTLGSLNIHFSLLPEYRGANPAEWAILCGEAQTGISLITMNTQIDAGNIISQRSLKITKTDTREALYESLYQLAASDGPEMIIKHHHWLQKQDANCQTGLAPRSQAKSNTPYARLLKRDDGYIPWPAINKAITGKELTPEDFITPLFVDVFHHLFYDRKKEPTQTDMFQLIERASRALYGYPGLWTKAPTSKEDKRLKIHTTSIYKNQLKLEKVQLEGQTISTFNQIKNQITPN